MFLMTIIHRIIVHRLNITFSKVMMFRFKGKMRKYSHRVNFKNINLILLSSIAGRKE